MRFESALLRARVDSVSSARREWLAAESCSESAFMERACKSAMAVTFASKSAMDSWMEVVCGSGSARGGGGREESAPRHRMQTWRGHWWAGLGRAGARSGAVSGPGRGVSGASTAERGTHPECGKPVATHEEKRSVRGK